MAGVNPPPNTTTPSCRRSYEKATILSEQNKVVSACRNLDKDEIRRGRKLFRSTS